LPSSLIAGFGVALLASLLLTPLVIRLAGIWGLYDSPLEARRLHSKPIPRLGGAAVFAAFIVPLLLVLLLEHLSGNRLLTLPGSGLLGVLVGAVILFTTGVVDDVRGLRPSTKVVFQTVAALAAYAGGCRVSVLSLGPTLEVHLGWFALPLTVLWIVSVTNAFNLIDGMDGLATGVALVALGTLLVAAVALGNLEVLMVAATLAGALVGFLRYNFNPARIFLGDSGSLFVGFMLAVLAVNGSMKSAAVVLVVVPVFALALPLVDTLVAIGRRWLRGVPLFGADAQHIHHRLLALGLTHRTAVLLLYSVAAILAMVGLLVGLAPPRAVAGIATAGGIASLVLVGVGMRRLDYHEFSVVGVVLAGAPLRLRWVIRDQIHARDLGRAIQSAQGLDQLQMILRERAPDFGFLDMQVGREAADLRGPDEPPTGRSWKLDFPFSADTVHVDDRLLLRIWSPIECGARPPAAERVARIIAPMLESWAARVYTEVEAVAHPVERPVKKRLLKVRVS